MGERKNLDIGKYFTRNSGSDRYNSFEFEKTNVNITDDEGKVIFTQKNVEFPKKWSPLAKKIVASKYFFGEQGTSEREDSIKELESRVCGTISEWSINKNYFSEEDAKIFRDELSYLVLDQKMSFNSPVWFNVGVQESVNKSKENKRKEAYIINNNGKVNILPIKKERQYPQSSACFIQSVDDSMEGIMELAKNEALLFKYGSGTGTNLSTLRSSKEKLSGGGKPSGPLAYWAFYDKVAGIVKSGGKTRRAAKMDILNTWHPDIMEFINSKMNEEKKLHILIDNGIPYKEAEESVNYQNTNISIKADDEFMTAIENNEKYKTKPINNPEMADEMPEYNAKDLIKKIAEATHFCGDPGMQFDTTINKWHTCPNSGKINASNPCSEFMFIDNSACNLASQNLMAFMKEDETFDVQSFSNAVRITAIAQDLLIDNSSYPTKKIAKNSHKFRPLGMGYANLGSLIMSLGFAYDSDESRNIAAAITALETGKVYETSTEMAEKIGTFKGYRKNKKPMMKVMRMHRDALSNIDKDKLPKGLESVLEEAERIWDNVIERGEKYGFRNSQATLLAPTGTIGFMMDCDTKGIEPEIGLVQTKLLSDGGTLRLINKNVEPILERLNYEKNQIKEIINYIDEKEAMEGAPHIKEEHLSIFDCSNKPKLVNRTISPKGHLKMMAAVQPFLSGAISKTVNLPKESTVEDIEQVYMDAWKMKLKAVALYRDKSKRVQPLNFSKEEKIAKAVRRKLPTTRDALIHKFDIASHEGYLTIGKYKDGNPGEIFMNMNKEGSTIGGLSDAFATSISFNLQYGVPLEKLVEKFKNQRFEPRGLVNEGHQDIKTADSIVDYIFNYLEKEFLGNGKENNGNPKKSNSVENNNKNKSIEKNSNHSEELGGFCAICGTQTFKKGHCNETCPECNWVNPKGCGE